MERKTGLFLGVEGRGGARTVAGEVAGEEPGPEQVANVGPAPAEEAPPRDEPRGVDREIRELDAADGGSGSGRGRSWGPEADCCSVLWAHHSPRFTLAPTILCLTSASKIPPIETSSAQYIIQQYTAASGGQRLQNSIRNAYAMGKVKMLACEFETAGRVMKNRHLARDTESGGFVLWQMNPDMWYVELAVGGSKVHAGCNGKLVWRHAPWLGAHTAKGPVRPLRRAIQGLDPRTTASMFVDARCIGEKKINGEDCFILKLCADPQTLKLRSEGPAEITRHVLFGYFSQKTGLLVHMEDSHLTRIQSIGGDAVYWETTINSSLDDYRPVEGIMIAHSGHSVVTLFRFGEMAMSHTKTRMEESWTIEEVAFNVPGLSIDCFIPPADLRSGSISEVCELPQEERGKSAIALAAHRAKVAALEKDYDDNIDGMVWKMEI
ncbi:glutamyl-tRNA (Gln) amidotransferase subunit A [Actinidia rufa]|uniref:Glutamyl-tRNA (Gln) amidotransferase subunit A n=1 Tax=Actinidia rufa TaxID=165716 RepID=A0A7J0F8G3_9ERIC|nr:glutamyl-tRNA (Gln) amidotransferase subunit A [Actinidia rufa]